MGSRDKRATGTAPSSGQPLRQEVDRLIAKGWYKDAVRQAKICHRDQPTSEHHRLLERAYLLRGQELQKNGMPAAAQEVAGHLLDFGVTDPELTGSVVTLLVAVGLASRALELQGRDASPEALDRLNKQAADQAVLHPERASGTPREIRDVAAKVRAALEALTLGDDPRSQELLRGVARTSPLADWRLFARGLAAFRKGEDADARASWDRLDPDRAASKIARSLIEATGSTLFDGPVAPKFDALERWALGEPIIGPLRELSRAVAQGLWPEAIRKLGSIRLALRRVDPGLASRLTEILYSPLLREASGLSWREGSNLIKGFTKVAEPLPIDPRWNRAWAQAWEGPQGHPAEAEPYWRKFLDDLESSTAIRPEDRPQARALVLTHMGKSWAGLADEFDPEDLPGASPGATPPVDEEAMAARRKAVTLLEEGRRLFPAHRATHQALIDAFRGLGQPDRVAAASDQLLRSLPDDLDTLKDRSNQYLGSDEPAKALELMLRARALKPLDADLLQSEWACRVSLSRQHALSLRWDEARAELATAERLLPEQSRSPHFAARKAATEIKAGRPEAASTILGEAQGRLAEPTALRLAMAIEARRLQLPQAEVDRFEQLFTGDVAKKVRAETAGELADLLGPFLPGNITYQGREEHVRLVAAYLGKTTRIKYARKDLSHACAFLEFAGGHDDLLKKLANRGLKLFPDAPEFPMLLGTVEMKKGPSQANIRQARGHFQAALRLAEAQAQADPKAAIVVPKIRQFLSVLDDLTGGPMGLPFFGRGKGGSPDDLFEAFQAMMGDPGAGPDDDDDDFDDEDDGYWGPPPSPIPDPVPRPPRKKKPKSKKKRK